jgi:tRNA pseudouridine-54 N-methylase
MPESTMLRFVQILPQVSPKGDFLLKDLPGSGKRIDVLCRDLAACFDWGLTSWPKSDLELIAVIGNTKILTFSDPKNQIPHGEVGWASVIRESLREEPPNYVDVSEGTLEDVIKSLNQYGDSKLWVLDEQGANLFETV